MRLDHSMKVFMTMSYTWNGINCSRKNWKENI